MFLTISETLIFANYIQWLLLKFQSLKLLILNGVYSPNDANYNAKSKATEGTGLEILTVKQMLQRLPIAPAQVKAGNNSESLLNEIRQIVYFLYQSKEITKKVYNNIIKSI